MIEPEQDMARQLIFRQLHPNVVNFFHLSKNVSLIEVSVENPRFFNKSLGELDFRKNYDVNVIGIVHDGHLNEVPLATDVINPHDQITLIGSNEAVQKLTISYKKISNKNCLENYFKAVLFYLFFLS